MAGGVGVVAVGAVALVGRWARLAPSGLLLALLAAVAAFATLPIICQSRNPLHLVLGHALIVVVLSWGGELLVWWRQRDAGRIRGRQASTGA